MIWFWFGAALAAAPLEEVLTSELDRAMAVFEQREEQPHYVALAVEDREEWVVAARAGTLAQSHRQRERLLDVDLRVGTPDFDSTRPLRGFSAMQADSRGRVFLPLDGEPELALRHAITRTLDVRYREEAERMVLLRANQRVKVEEEDPAPDFEPREPVRGQQEVARLELDVPAWESTLVEVSRRLERSPHVHAASASLQGSHVHKTFVDSEGTRLQHGGNALRVTLALSTTADDGDHVRVHRAFDVHHPDRLPPREALLSLADEAVTHLEALREAPRGQPYSGPVILGGRAAGVFFHEVFGHRVEGHRQKRDDEGKTFARQVGERILPESIDVYDDPRLQSLAGHDLNGHYLYDDEGVPAGRADLVREGRFVGFLMNRSPLADFPHTTGHGRRMAGAAPVARMGNLVIEAREAVPREQLREMLLEEVRAQGLPFGVLVEEIDGGFTLTGRVMPNAFNVRASSSWRVYADGRPDELVRGIDLVGTPFAAFANLVAAGDDIEVFNGHCGAESGWVPVSAVAPSMLFRKLEFQLKEKGEERPPLLAKPALLIEDAARLEPAEEAP